MRKEGPAFHKRNRIWMPLGKKESCLDGLEGGKSAFGPENFELVCFVELATDGTLCGGAERMRNATQSDLENRV
jgi:hypothetical protein